MHGLNSEETQSSLQKERHLDYKAANKWQVNRLKTPQEDRNTSG